MVCVGVVAWFLLTIGYPCTYIRVVRSDAVADNTGLLELYDSTGGQDGLWRESRDWGILSDHCQWYGVTCNNDGEVEELRLPDNGLEGNLDVQDLWNLDSLKVLDLSKNSLSGGIPAGISSLPSLTVLDLSSNNLTGNLPPEWLSVQDSASRPLIHDEVYVSGTFPALQAFKVARNNISEDVYMAIQMAMGWKELQVIDISENNLAGELFGALELRHCSSGSVGCNDITLTVHSALTVLLISGNNIEGTLDDIGLLPPTLSVLDISANKLWGGISNDFSQLLLLRLSENSNLNATVLPRFTALSTNSTSAVDGVFFCPDITPAASDGHSMYLEIDASYYMEGGNRSHCMCGDGMGINTDSASCIDCPVGTFSESAGECIACPNRSTTVGQGRSSLKSCVCEVDSFREITTGDGECTACPIGSSTEGVMGGTSVAMCTCNPGLYLSMNEGTNGQQPSCEPCPVGTYKGVSGNSALLCFPCPPGSFGNITGATSEEDCILCPLGTYNNASGGASSSLCIPCPKGTYGQNQTGLFSPSLCIPCPAGTWLGSEGATTAASCELCPENTFSVHIGVTSAESCVPCGDSATSTAGSFVCAGGTGNTKEKLLTYLGVGMGTFIAVFFMLVTWKKKLEKGKAVVDQHTYHLEQQRVMPIRMAKEKRIAHKWAFLFNALETLDIVAASEGVLGGAIIVLYLIIVSIGSSLTIYRLYMVWWVYYRLRNIYISETRPLKAFESLDRKCTRQMITSGQSHLVPEIVLMLNKLQVNKFKIQLAVVVDIPLTFLNLWILWSVEIILIQNPAYIISLCVSTFSAGKISTLIEYHMEIRKRMKKLENLLSIELWGNEEGDMVFDLEGAAVSPDNDDSASELGVFNMDLIQASEESAESEEIRRLNAVYPIDGHVEDAKDPTPPPTPYVAPKKTCSDKTALIISAHNFNPNANNIFQFCLPMDKETQQTRLDPIQGQSTGVQYRNIEVEQHKRPYMEHVEVGQQRVVKQDVKDGQNGQLAPQGVTITGEQQNISSQPLGFNGLKAYNTHMYASQQAAQAHKLYKEQMAQRQAQAQPQAQPQPHNVQPSKIKLEHQVQQQLAPHEIVKQRQAVQPSSGQQISPELARHPAMPSVQQAEKLQPVPSVPTTNTTAVEEKKRHAELPVRAYLDQTVVPIIVSGLVELVRSRPEDPVKWLANYLLAHNPQKSYNQPRLP